MATNSLYNSLTSAQKKQAYAANVDPTKITQKNYDILYGSKSTASTLGGNIANALKQQSTVSAP